MKKIGIFLFALILLTGCTKETPFTCDEGYKVEGNECIKEEEPLTCQEGFILEGEECIEEIVLSDYELDYQEHLTAIDQEESVVYNGNIDAFTLSMINGMYDMKMHYDSTNQQTKIAFSLDNETPNMYDSYTYQENGIFYSMYKADLLYWTYSEIDYATNLFETVVLDYSSFFMDAEKETEEGFDVYKADVTVEDFIQIDPTIWYNEITQSLDSIITITVKFNSTTDVMEYLQIDASKWVQDSNKDTDSNVFTNGITYEDLYYKITFTLDTETVVADYIVPSHSYLDTGVDERHYLPLSTAIELDTIIEGMINYEDDNDYFKLVLEEETTISFEVVSIDSDKNIQFGIMDFVGNSHFVTAVKVPETSEPITLQAGTYYIRVVKGVSFNSSFTQLFDEYSFRINTIE